MGLTKEVVMKIRISLSKILALVIKALIIIWALALVALPISFLKKCTDRNYTRPGNDSITKIDTIYVDRVIEVEKPFEKSSIPRTIYLYQTDTVEVMTTEIRHDTIWLKTKDSSELSYSLNFLTNHPSAPKLLQFDVSKKALDLSLMYPNGSVQRQLFDVDMDRFQYRWTYSSNLSQKKMSFWKKIDPVVELSFRPIHLMTDVNLGLRYSSRRFYYEAGLNGFYYPTIKKNPSVDVYLKVGVSFK